MVKYGPSILSYLTQEYQMYVWYPRKGVLILCFTLKYNNAILCGSEYYLRLDRDLYCVPAVLMYAVSC